MAKKFRAGTVGAGSIAQHLHIPGYLNTPAVEFLAACDPGAKQRKRVTELVPDATVYQTHEKMLAEQQLDVVSVCTPNYLHAEHAIAALQAGAHVILEKPAALTLAELGRIEKARDKAGRMVVVGYSHRFKKGPRKARDLIAKGTIGEPFMIRVRFAHTGPYPGWAHGPWFYDPVEAGGGALLDMGIHAIDLCQWMVGPVEDVAAQVGTLRKDIEVDDNALMALRFANGRAMGYIEVGWTSPAGFTGLEIFGDEGCITVDYTHGMRLTTGRITPDHATTGGLKTRLIMKDPDSGGWEVEIPGIVRGIRREDDLDMGLDSGAAALAVAIAAYQSAKTGKRVKPKA